MLELERERALISQARDGDRPARESAFQEIFAALRTTARKRKRTTLPLESEPTARSADDPLVAAELTAEFGKALAALPFRERVVLSLCSVEGLSHGEIAEILGIPVGTVWSRLHTARKRLLVALGPHLEDRPGSRKQEGDRVL